LRDIEGFSSRGACAPPSALAIKRQMTRAAAWLEELGPGQYAQVLARQSTAFDVISDLTEVDLCSP
jgi:hypothetical protein